MKTIVSDWVVWSHVRKRDRFSSADKKRSMKLAALIKTPSHAVYRYRLQPFEPMLREHRWDVSLNCIGSNWLSRMVQFSALRDADAVLLQRRLLSRAEVYALRRFSRRLVYDFDDAILYRSSNSPKGPYSRKRRARFAAVVRAADAVIAGNSFLAELANRYTSPAKVHMIPTCLDATLYPMAKHEKSRGAIQMVWIGSASTVRSVERISEHLKAVSHAVPGARLKLICNVFPEDLPVAIERCFWSAEREAPELAAADVGISWMPEGPWSRGKCGLKVLQYMAAGLPVVANPVGVHREMIVHGENGFLAEKPEEWAEALRILAGDPELRRAMGRAGRNTMVERYSPACWADAFASVVSGDGEKLEVKRESWRFNRA